ncbi:DNA double-strand break repair nuclease NurA [Arsukibacterium sp.]|uniref:DNA double-strand break repair nuclease NurA n=1 Tax=Arsukibacterium sp. TaxID=1977258 RepID=UPI001BD47C0E|nr:DNA double-strand break repair nuclease NurA [Arsukibacterium sp.]
MPYSRERASKGGHSDLVRNPDVSAFLSECDFIKEPTEEETREIVSGFVDIPLTSALPSKVFASDASPYSEPINGLFPSTQIGYVKNSIVLIDVNSYEGLKSPKSRFVDPFKVAELHRNADAISFTLPGSNIRYKGAKTVADGFRKAVWEQLSDDRTKMAVGGDFNVAGTLLAIEPDNVITITKCPSCKDKPPIPFIFSNVTTIHICEQCHEEVYLTDSLRLHEPITEFGDNTSAITRFMNVVEHLNIANLIRMLHYYQPETLSEMAFFVDGPLAIFGEPADIHSRLMKLYFQIFEDLKGKGYREPLILGLIKTGQVAEHANSLNRQLKKYAKSLNKIDKRNSVRLLTDEYKGRWISGKYDPEGCKGYETYYGQDFLFKTDSGRIFTFCIPYPFERKGNRKDFQCAKTELSKYRDTLDRTLGIIKFFELELYENAVVPVALAHRHASISLMPGGKVLELVSRNGLNVKNKK